MSKELLNVQGFNIKVDKEGYICLTDIANAKGKEKKPAAIIQNWLRNKNTIDFLGVWELINNQNFKVLDFEYFKSISGKQNFTLSVNDWVDKTDAIGIYSLKGKTGGTYAHVDIAFEFGASISPSFKLYLIKDYQRLKEQESNSNNIEWNVRRLLSKEHYHILTDAVKRYKIPTLNLPVDKIHYAYSEEGDIINLAMWNMSAKTWRFYFPILANKNENMRHYASVNELIVIGTLSSFDAEMIKLSIPYNDRLERLTKIAKEHLEILNNKNPENSLKKSLSGTFQPLYKEEGKPFGIFPQPAIENNQRRVA